jgi:hypothetical protein
LGDVAKKAQGNLQWRRCWPPRGIGKPFSARVMGSAEYPARCGLWLPRRAATAKNMHRLRALRLERDEKSNGTGSGTRTDQIPT